MTLGTLHVPKWVIVSIAALTLLIEAPLIALPFYAGDSYRGINIAPIGNDELFYLSRAKAVLDGRPLGQPFMTGVANVPDSFMSDIEYVYMVPLRALGLAPYVDVPMVYNILNTVGVFTLVLLIYLLMFALTENVFLSAAAAIFAIGGYYWVEYRTVIYLLLTGKPIFQSMDNIFGRSADPYTALVPFFGFLICTYRALMQDLPRPNLRPSFRGVWPYRYVIGAGVLFGVLFYDYFYAWTFALAVIGSVTLTSILWRRWSSAITAVVIGGIGSVLGAYQLHALYTFYSSAWGNQISFFLLSARGHSFIQSSTGIATSILFAIYWYFRRDDKNNFFILALILAGWIALEQQMITGRMVQYGHYYWYFVVPLSVIIATYMGVRLISMYSDAWAKWASVALIGAALINTAGGQYKSFFVNVQDSMRQQDFAPIMDKLNVLPEGAVLGDPGGPSTSILLTVYTKKTNYFSYSGIVNVFPVERFREALLVYLYLNKESRGDPVAYLRDALSKPATTNYTDMYETMEAFYSGIPLQDYYRNPSPHTDPRILSIRHTFLSQIGKEYGEFASSPKHARDILTERGVRYILWDRRAYPEWDPSIFAPLTVLATSTDVILYSFSTTR
jgi:hypothetical protein